MNVPIKLLIPKKQVMVRTNIEDPVFFHYYPITRILYRKRLKNTLSLMQPYRFKKLLEIGYGSGIFLPTLSRLADEVSAIDIHTETAGVKRMLDWYQISNVSVLTGDIMKMSYADNEFDGCVIVSTLENIENSERAVGEIMRVVQPDGTIFISFPVENTLTNMLFRLAGQDPAEIHPSNHRYILNFLRKNFTIQKMITYPSFLPPDASLYISVLCKNDGLKQRHYKN